MIRAMNIRSMIMPTKGRRTPGKPGRFDPSEPLHMTTRHAKRNGRPNGSPSGNSSAEDDESHRESLDDPRPTTADSFGSQTSAKRWRISNNSTNDAPETRLFSEREQTSLEISNGSSDSIAPVKQVSPSRKRKRSNSTSPSTPMDDDIVTSTLEERNDFRHSLDAVKVVPVTQVSDRESEDGSEYDEEFSADYLGIAQSTELTPSGTPMDSEAVSPISEESQSGTVFPNEREEIDIVDPVQSAYVDEQDLEDGDDLAEVDDLEDADDLEDVDDQVRVDEDGRPRRKVAGRRRAHHPEPDIEATMRRQLQLKSAYRSIARALKPVLAEISLKTVEELENNPCLHERTVEYQGDLDHDGIQAALDQALAVRRSRLDAQFKWNSNLLRTTYNRERELCRSRYNLRCHDFKQLQLDRLEHDLLIQSRRTRLEDSNMAHETEDEDQDVMPVAKRTAYKFKRSGTLDSKYDSRSRLALESDQAISDLQHRLDMHHMLQELSKEDQPDVRVRDFTIMDSVMRDNAVARKQSLLNTNILAEAAAEAERISNIPVLPNEVAFGLQLLGDLASRPSIRATVPSVKAQRARDHFVDSTAPVPMPPPPVPLGIAFDSRYADVSSRAPGFPERFNLAATPLPSRQSSMPEEQVIEERTLLSPMTSVERGTALPSAKLSEAKHLPRQEALYTPSRQRQHDVFDLSPSSRPGMVEIAHSNAHSTQFTHSRAHSREGPLWERYHRTLSIDREPRQLASVDRAIHQFSHAGPLSIERVEPIDSRPSRSSRECMKEVAKAKEDSPSDHLLHRRPMVHQDWPSNASAEGSRPTLTSSPTQRLRESPVVKGYGAPREVVPLDMLDNSREGVEPQASNQHTREIDSINPYDTAHQNFERRKDGTHVSGDEFGQLDHQSLHASLDKSRSRASSVVSQSTGAEASPDDAATGEMGQRSRQSKGPRSSLVTKPSRTDRSGLSRKVFRGSAKKAGTPHVHRFRLNAVDNVPSTTRGSNPASSALPPPATNDYYYSYPYGVHPPTSGYQYSSGPSAFPPQTQPSTYQYPFPYDYGASYQHRNSYPSLIGPWQPQFPPPSPLYAVPKRQPPPTGPSSVSPDQWTVQHAARPPLDHQGQPAPLPPQQNTNTGACVPTPRGPPIAPAAPDSRYPPLYSGGPTNHPPAFAQQQKQHETENRKRAKSDAPGHTFKSWAPKKA